MLSLIAAQENKGGIGFNNGLPWNIPDDLAYFKKVTTHVTTILQQNEICNGKKKHGNQYRTNLNHLMTGISKIFLTKEIALFLMV